MKTAHDILRARITPGSDPHRDKEREAKAKWKQLEVGAKIMLDLARPRILTGYFRYGNQRSRPYMAYLRDKFELYEETGNKEFLVDMLNYLLLEWLNPFHAKAHFQSTERDD